MSELKIDRTLRNVIPALTSAEYEELEDSIQREGCRDPIIVWNGLIIDGHNRYDICKKNNVPFDVRDMEFDDKGDALTWMITNQLGRRNLNSAQKIELALKRDELIGTNIGMAGEKSQCNIALSTEKRKEIAKEVNVGERNVAKVKKVLEVAPEEVKDKMRKGEISINKAHKSVSPSKPKKPKPKPEETPVPKMGDGYIVCSKCNGTGRVLQKKKSYDCDYPWDNDSLECPICGKMHKVDNG